MTADEATVLASQIDKSLLPVHVKQVTCNGIVIIQHDETGYTLPILSTEHWKQYAKQQGDNNAIDEFASAGISIMAQLETMIASLTTERDALMSQAEQVDTQIVRLAQNKATIEAAIMAVDNVSLHASLRGVTVAPAQPIKKRREGAPKQDWVAKRLHQDGRVRVAQLADEMSAEFQLTRKEAIKAISGVLSRLMKINPYIHRVALGEYVYTTQERHTDG